MRSSKACNAAINSFGRPFVFLASEVITKRTGSLDLLALGGSALCMVRGLGFRVEGEAK